MQLRIFNLAMTCTISGAVWHSLVEIFDLSRCDNRSDDNRMSTNRGYLGNISKNISFNDILRLHLNFSHF